MGKENQFWNQYAKRYDRIINKGISESYRKLYKRLKEDTKDLGDVLEIATGTGEIALLVAENAHHVVAVDFAENMIAIAKEKVKTKGVGNIVLSVMDACALDFEDAGFDMVICSNALHLMSHPEIAMQEMKRVLKQDGLIIVPTYCHGQTKKSKMISKIMSITGFKARNRWSSKAFVSFVESCGFNVMKKTVFEDSVPMVYLKAEKKKQGEF